MTEQDMLNPEINDGDEDEQTQIIARDAQDHLPHNETLKIILNGIFYTAFTLLLLAVIISAFTAEGSITGIGWFIIVLFALGVLAGGYSAFDEFIHLKGAIALDKNGKIESVTILDDWKDHYLDGGILSRKDVYHIIYKYADGQEYAKHSVKRSIAPIVKTNGKIKVQYLPEDPTIFRPIIGE